MIEGYWYEINPEEYVVEANGLCHISFIASSSDYWILGIAFHRGYYIIHDIETDKLGVSVHVESTKSTPDLGTIP